MKKVLSGIHILDFSDALAGPYCTRYMADCGAEVLNIEKPGGKTAWRKPYLHKGFSLEHLYNHCGKKSIVVDMKKEGSRELILKLAKTCDVVVENFRPGVMKGFKLTYDDFQVVNPSIIMCSISGWGQEGPRAEHMATDISIQSGSGILNLTGELGRKPVLVGFPVTDFLAGLNAFGAVCAALYRRSVTGQGEYIDIAMTDCALNCLHVAVGVHSLTEGKEELCTGSYRSESPSHGIYKGKDGYLAISAETQVGWERLTEIMEKPELATDPRFGTEEARLKNEAAVVKYIEEWLDTFERVADVAALLQSFRIQSAPVISVGQLIDDDEQFKFRGMLKELEHPVLGKVKFLTSPLRFKNSSASTDIPPPVSPGQDTYEVLKNTLDMKDDEIEILKEQGIISDTR